MKKILVATLLLTTGLVAQAQNKPAGGEIFKEVAREKTSTVLRIQPSIKSPESLTPQPSFRVQVLQQVHSPIKYEKIPDNIKSGSGTGGWDPEVQSTDSNRAASGYANLMVRSYGLGNCQEQQMSAGLKSLAKATSSQVDLEIQIESQAQLECVQKAVQILSN